MFLRAFDNKWITWRSESNLSYGPKWFGRKPVKRYDLTLTANNSSSDDFETSHYGHSVRCQISNIDSDDKLKTFFLYDNRISEPVQMEANDKKKLLSISLFLHQHGLS